MSVATALPPYPVEQSAVLDRLRVHWGEHRQESREWRILFEKIFQSASVQRRHFALPLEEYAALASFEQANEVWRRVATELGTSAARSALSAAGIAPAEVDNLFLITGTGIATPSIDAAIANRLGLRRDLRRTPIFGLGCAGGVAGIARAAELLRGASRSIALVIAVELCSLTLQRDDHSIANVIAAALFGDGAAAAVLSGAAARHRDGAPQILATRSVFYPDTEAVMGWQVVNSGLKIVLSPTIPDLIRRHLGDDVDAFLADHGLTRDQIHHWIAHTGGNRVLEAVASALSLPRQALDRSWRLLAHTGNLSSASALFVLHDVIKENAGRPGDFGMMFAMGPGFCSELVLLQW